MHAMPLRQLDRIVRQAAYPFEGIHTTETAGLDIRVDAGEGLCGLDAANEQAVVAEDRNTAHLLLADVVGELQTAILKAAHQTGELTKGIFNRPKKIRFGLLSKV